MAERPGMQRVELAGYECRVFPGIGKAARDHVYFMDVAAQPVDAAAALRGIESTVVAIEVVRWDDDLTPWPAEGLYPGDADFKGCANETLAKLCDGIMPGIEALLGGPASNRALSGYSLGGLFALYGFLADERFRAAASMSGSLWYEGWPAHLDRMAASGLAGRFAYLSIGDRERFASPAILHRVEERTRATAAELEAHGAEVEFRLSKGSHFEHVNGRVNAGFSALDAFFRKTAR